jgi:phospholipase/carboxylesterase
MAPYGRQWFSVQDRSPARMLAGMQAAADHLGAFLDAETARLGLAMHEVALMGFSQGAMTALFAGLRRSAPPAAILAYSGRLIAPELLPAELRSRPPVLLVHGEADEVVPIAGSQEAERMLRELGVPVESAWCPGLEHGIDEAGIALGALMLQRHLAPDGMTAA